MHDTYVYRKMTLYKICDHHRFLPFVAGPYFGGLIRSSNSIPSGGLLWSQNGTQYLRVQTDGNLVAYGVTTSPFATSPSDPAIWATGTNGQTNSAPSGWTGGFDLAVQVCSVKYDEQHLK